MRRRRSHLVPSAPRSVRSVAEYAVDELFMAVQGIVRELPSKRDVEIEMDRVSEMAAELAHLAPNDLHPSVIEPRNVELHAEPRSWRGSTWELLSFDAPPTLPGPLDAAAAWLRQDHVQRAQVRIMRHHDGPRPWIIAVHGAEQGRDFDVKTFRSHHLHHGLGFNVAMPILPLHGPRRSDGIVVPGFDVVANVVFTLAAVTEVRALRQWISTQGDPAVALFGVSLGGYTAAVTAGVEPRLDLVLAGIPMVSMHRLLARHVTKSVSPVERTTGMLLRSEPVLELERFVDPLRFQPAVPVDRRFVMAGLIDRITTPYQALELWHHWGEPPLLWYPGGHTGHIWSKQFWESVDEALSRLDARPARPVNPARPTNVSGR